MHNPDINYDANFVDTGTPEVVLTTTDAINDGKDDIMTTLYFQCHWFMKLMCNVKRYILFTIKYQ